MLGAAPRPPFDAFLPHASVLAVCFGGYEELVASKESDAGLVRLMHLLHLRVDNVLSAWPGVYKLWESQPGHCLVVSHTGATQHAELLVRLAVRLRSQFAEDYLPCGRPVRLLMSVCSGPLATGVIGGGHLQFHAYGPAALLARAMNRAAYQSALPDGILVSDLTRRLLGDARRCAFLCSVSAAPGAPGVPAYLYMGSAPVGQPAPGAASAAGGWAAEAAGDAGRASPGAPGARAGWMVDPGRGPELPAPECPHTPGAWLGAPCAACALCEECGGSADEERSVCAAAGPPSAYPPLGAALGAGARAAGAAAAALAAAPRALRFEGDAVEARFRRGYYASQLSTDVVFYFILLASQAAWVWKWEWTLGEGLACLVTMCGLLALNCGMCAWAVCARASYLRHRERAGVVVHLAHRVAQAVVTVHGTTQSARYTPLTALMESSFMAANMMLAFGLKLRWEAHVPVNLFHAALSALQNRQICAAAWPGAPAARCELAMLGFELVFCLALPCALLWRVERRARAAFASSCKATD